MTVRVRYAPSPTGFQHIGGVFAALRHYTIIYLLNTTVEILSYVLRILTLNVT